MTDYVAIVEALATRYRANSYPGDSDAETADALDALLRDARRYQWLRQTRREFMKHPEWDNAWNRLELGEGTDDGLDAAIDAAMGAK